jgi:hypothetical protein
MMLAIERAKHWVQSGSTMRVFWMFGLLVWGEFRIVLFKLDGQPLCYRSRSASVAALGPEARRLCEHRI